MDKDKLKELESKITEALKNCEMACRFTNKTRGYTNKAIDKMINYWEGYITGLWDHGVIDEKQYRYLRDNAIEGTVHLIKRKGI